MQYPTMAMAPTTSPPALAAAFDEPVVDELTSKGVAVEHYDEPPVVTDERGIATFHDGKVGYFKDPDGNVLSIGSQT